MNRHVIGLALVASVGFAPAVWSADQYAIETAHTGVGFSVPHLVISRVQGTFKDVSGTIVYDEQDVTKSSVSVTIKAESINTNVEDRDKHLRSPDFFDVATYPTIAFQSTRIEKQGDGYVCYGKLTIHGVEKDVPVTFKILGKIQDPWGKTRLGVEGQATINRQEFGVKWNKTMDSGGVVVGDEVKIALTVEAVLQPPAQPPAVPATP